MHSPGVPLYQTSKTKSLWNLALCIGAMVEQERALPIL